VILLTYFDALVVSKTDIDANGYASPPVGGAPFFQHLKSNHLLRESNGPKCMRIGRMNATKSSQNFEIGSTICSKEEKIKDKK